MEEEQPTQRLKPEAIAQSAAGVPLVFKRYRLVRELGKGGMGAVWLARDMQLDQTEVALKFLKSELANDPQALHDLKQEVLNNRNLAHANITRAFNLESDESEPDPSRRVAISMEYVKGTSLSALKLERIKQGRVFEPEDILQWVRQLCNAMQHAHEVRDAGGNIRPVVHRDIKPANLLVSSAGDLKVCDFGIGCTVAETMSRLTNQTTPSGTLPYMSPQQIAGKTPAPSHDIYSIGATIYELLTGQPPFFRGAGEALIEQIKNEIPPSIADRRKELGRTGKAVPANWEQTIASCLAKESEKRPVSVQMIRELLEGEKAAPAPGVSRRHVALAAVAGLALAAGAAYFLWPRPEAAPLRPAPHGTTPGIASVASARPDAGQVSISAPKLRSGIQALVDADRLTRDEGQKLEAALDGQHGDHERELAYRLLDGRLASVDEWRRISALSSVPDPLAQKLRAMLGAGTVKEAEFFWLYDAATGKKGPVEKILADQAVGTGALPLEKWRRQSDYGPAETRDPHMEQVKPLLAAKHVSFEEAEWLRDALAGDKNSFEQVLARRLVNGRQLSVEQWRNWSDANPAVKREPAIEAIKPYLLDRQLIWPEAAWLRAALAEAKGPDEQALARRFLVEKTVTIGQWRARTALPYGLAEERILDRGALPPALDLTLGPGVTLRLLRVEPGTFARGTPGDEPGRRPNELAVDNVTLKEPFYLGVTEVTQAQFMALMGRSPSYWRGNPTWPIDQVDWTAINGPQGFLARLNRILAGHLNGAFVADLPTEDEWEYACRAGTQASFNNGRFISSLESDPALDILANYNRASSGSPKPVGSYQPNAWGFYDMHGNVSEWCRDRFVRGGSWQSKAANCRVGARTQVSAEAAPSNQIGFRLSLRLKSAAEGGR